MPRTLTWTPDQDLRQRKKQGNRRSSSPPQSPQGGKPGAGPPKRGPKPKPGNKPSGNQTSARKPSRPTPPKEKRHNIAELYVLKQIREKTPMVIHSYQGVEYGLFVKLSKYHLTTVVDGAKKGNEKLELSCYYKQRDEDAVHQTMRHDAQTAAQDLAPVRPRKDRYEVANEALAQYRRDNTLVRVSLRTGEVFDGQIQWFTPFDLGLMLPTKVKVMIFRHAISNLEPIVAAS